MPSGSARRGRSSTEKRRWSPQRRSADQVADVGDHGARQPGRAAQVRRAVPRTAANLRRSGRAPRPKPGGGRSRRQRGCPESSPRRARLSGMRRASDSPSLPPGVRSPESKQTTSRLVRHICAVRQGPSVRFVRAHLCGSSGPICAVRQGPSVRFVRPICAGPNGRLAGGPAKGEHGRASPRAGRGGRRARGNRHGQVWVAASPPSVGATALASAGLVALAGPASADGPTTFTNAGAISVPDVGTASPYPSSITVSRAWRAPSAPSPRASTT